MKKVPNIIKAPESIPKNPQFPPGKDQRFLFLRGIELIQELASKHWTDYNLHDPGVTILEILSYALTELGYKTGLPAADLWSDPKGQINFQKSALYSARQIFTTHPLTLNDYRKFVIDSSENIRNAWIDLSPDNCINIRLYLNEKLGKEAKNAEIQQLRSLFYRNRNIGDRLGTIEVLRSRKIALKVHLDLDNITDAKHIIAAALVKVTNYLAPIVQFRSLDEMLELQVPAEDIFAGPALHYGFIPDNQLAPFRSRISNYEVVSLLKANGIDKVTSISWVWNKKPDTGQEQNIFKVQPSEILSLDIDQTVELLQVSVKGSKMNIDPLSIQSYFYKLLDKQNRNTRLNLTPDQHDFPPIKGTYRNLQHFDTIQNDFPHTYGINQFGLAGNETPLRKAQALQLKAYLVFFEQIMANYLGQLSHLPSLFSFEKMDSTLFFNPVYKIPQLNRLLRPYTQKFPGEDPLDYNWNTFIKDPENNFVKAAQKILKDNEDFSGRRNAFLDFMLSFFAEKITVYDSGNPHIRDEIMTIKENFLRNYVSLSSNRGRSSGEGFSAISGPEANLRIVLNIPQRPEMPIYRLLQTYVAIMPEGSGEEHSSALFNMLTALTNERNYSYRETTPGLYQLKLKIADSPKVILMEKVPLADIRNIILQIQKKARQLNRQLDNFYVIDHAVLQNPQTGLPEETAWKGPKGFYNNRISYIFPSFTSRFGEPGFREYIVTEVYRFTPAHIRPFILWLNPGEMESFEQLYVNANDSRLQDPAEVYEKKLEALSLFICIKAAEKFHFDYAG